MNKAVLILLMLFFHVIGNVSASEVVETGKEVEIKDRAIKTFIHQTVHVRLLDDMSHYYHEKYNAKSVGWESPNPEKVRIWIKEVKSSSGQSTYTHIIKVFLPQKVTINDKTEIKAEDTFIYAVNGNLLTLCLESSGKTKEQIKLIDSYHKVLP